MLVSSRVKHNLRGITIKYFVHSRYVSHISQNSRSLSFGHLWQSSRSIS